MAKYTVQRAYLMPMYQNIVVEADSIEEACEKALEYDTWDGQEDDPESSSSTYLDMIVEGEFDNPNDAPAEARREIPPFYSKTDALKWELKECRDTA